MSPQEDAAELRAVLRHCLPCLGKMGYGDALAAVRRLEEAAVRCLQDEVRRLGT